MEVADDESGLVHWMSQIKNGMTRQNIYDFFIKTANDENNKNQPARDFGDLFDNNGRKRILLVTKESGGDIFIMTSLFKQLKALYPDSDLYVGIDPKFSSILEGNEYVYRILPYHPAMESEMSMMHYVDYYYYPQLPTQKQLAYLTKDKIGVEIK